MQRQFNANLLNLGDTIEFTRKYESAPVQAVVVRMTTWAHCPGANEFTVWCLDNSARNLCSLPMCCGNYKVVAKVASAAAGAAKVEQARQAYKAHLAQFPVWAARFAQGGEVQF